MIKNVFCTYFNIGYLSRGVALYKSMEECISEFSLYIFACDESCINNLKMMGLSNAIIVDVNECIDDEAKAILSDRSGTSFYWSLAPLTILHVLNKYHEEWCTYVDADCYFYKDPSFVFSRMNDLNKSVGIVEHNFRTDENREKLVEENGRFCVEFNTFRNTLEGLEVLKAWREQCLEPCSVKAGGDTFGDQLYLNEWPNQYNCIYIVENKGVGIAPWNINDGYGMEDIVMYHFHGLHFLGKHIASLNIWNINSFKVKKYIYDMYRDYINMIQNIEKNVVFKRENQNDNNLCTRVHSVWCKIKARQEKNIAQVISNIIWI